MTKVRYHMTEHEPEWEITWEKFEDRILLNTMTGDAWEYMDSRLMSDGNLWHGFRHRCHPETLMPSMRFIQASKGWREPIALTL